MMSDEPSKASLGGRSTLRSRLLAQTAAECKALKRYIARMGKRKLTVYLDPDVARATRVRAARSDRPDSRVVEDALRAHLGMAALDQSQKVSKLSEDEALELANSELHAARRERA